MIEIKSILLIEKDTAVRNIIGKIIHKISKNIEFQTTDTFREAFSLLKKGSVQLVLLGLTFSTERISTFLLKKEEAENKVPVIVLSSPSKSDMLKTFEVLKAGAIDFITRPLNYNIDLDNICIELTSMLEMLATNYPILDNNADEIPQEEKKPKRSSSKILIPNKVKQSNGKINLIAIGLSIGGTKALVELITSLPKKFKKPFLVVLQIHEAFLKPFSQALSEITPMQVTEAAHHNQIEPGMIFLAPGGKQMGIIQCGEKALIEVTYTDRVSGHLPSIDYLFRSLADICGQHTLCILMSGTGKDGVSGLRMLKSKGAITLSQDKESSVTFEKSKIAIDQGIIDEIVSLKKMPKRIREIIELSEEK